MERLSGVEELLDGPLDDPAALAANLRDLSRLNRLSGGARLSLRAARTLGEAATILDVGTGAADIPAALLADAQRRGVPLEVTATDSRPEILAAAALARPGLPTLPGLTLAVADGRALPFPDASFDVGHASMVIHHLDGDEAVPFLRELRRVSRLGIVVNDLARGPHFWLATWLLTHTVAASRFTRHDGPLSVRRAWTHDEMVALLGQAGLAPVATISGFAGHRYAIAAR